MHVVKLPNRENLDLIIAKLTLRLGRKVSQQEILNACLKISSNHLDELEQYFSNRPQLTKKQVEEILKLPENFDYISKGSIDEDLYG
ncbi:hypothetical protein ES703_90540 [subsurface metagenome]